MVRRNMESPALGLLNPTRKALVLGIKERGQASAEELGAAAFLSVAAVRVHLNSLEQLGIVSHVHQRKGPGRPLHLYRLTEAGEALFPQTYSGILRSVLGAVSRDSECEAKVMHFIEASQVALLRQHVTAEDLTGRPAEVVESKAFVPFLPEYEQTGPNSWCVRFHHCPLNEVAREYPEFCVMERRVLETVLGDSARVEPGSLISEGAVTCSLTISAPD